MHKMATTTTTQLPSFHHTIIISTHSSQPYTLKYAFIRHYYNTTQHKHTTTTTPPSRQATFIRLKPTRDKLNQVKTFQIKSALKISECQRFFKGNKGTRGFGGVVGMLELAQGVCGLVQGNGGVLLWKVERCLRGMVEAL